MIGGVSLGIYVDPPSRIIFLRLCNGVGLSQELLDDLSRGRRGSDKIWVRALLSPTTNNLLFDVKTERWVGLRERVQEPGEHKASPEVFAVLFSLLHPSTTDSFKRRYRR